MNHQRFTQLPEHASSVTRALAYSAATYWPARKRPVTHFIQHNYSRIIQVSVYADTKPEEVISTVACLEGNDPSDYRFLRME